MKIYIKLILCLGLFLLLSACAVVEDQDITPEVDDTCVLVEESDLGSANSNTQVIFQDVFGLSSEGGYLQAIMSDDNLQYLYVKLFGVLGQIEFRYSFIGDSVIISITQENYTKPFYMMPSGELHISSTERAVYILLGGTLYLIPAESDELIETTAEMRDEIVDQMNQFIALIEQK